MAPTVKLRSIALGPCLAALGCGGSARPAEAPRPAEGEPAVVAIDRPEPDQEEPVAEVTTEAPLLTGKLDTGWSAALRDKRPGPRIAKLVQTELTALQRLLSVTPKRSPDRAPLLHRVAMAALELARAHDKDGKPDEAKHIRQQGIEHLEQHAKEFPSDRRHDEVLYHLALARERSGDIAAARKAYFELVKQAPKSKFVPAAYLAFGEIFFRQAQTDASKPALAEQMYKQVLKHPPPDNWLYGYAAYQLGRVQAAKQDHVNALNSQRKAVEFTLRFKALPQAQGLHHVAGLELVRQFARVGRADKARPFFERVVTGAFASELLIMLAREYLQGGQLKQVEVLAKDALRGALKQFECVNWGAILEELQHRGRAQSLTGLLKARCPKR